MPANSRPLSVMMLIQSMSVCGSARDLPCAAEPELAWADAEHAQAKPLPHVLEIILQM